MEFILAALLGLLIGAGVNWASDVLPRFAAEPPTYLPSQPPFRFALLNLFRQRRGRWFRLHLLVEGVSVAVALLLVGQFGFSLTFFALLFVYVLFVLIAVTDVKHRLVLNVVTYPAIIAAILLHLFIFRSNPTHVLLGGMFAFIIFAGTAWLRPGDLGWGDVKLALLVGVACGFPYVLYALLVGAGIGGIVAVVLMIQRRSGASSPAKTTMPYAPFLCLGALLVLLYVPLMQLS